MNTIRRLTAALAGLAGALLVYAAAPVAFARPFPPRVPGWDKHPPLPPPGAWIHVVVVGGMPGWQIALIAIGLRCSRPPPRLESSRNGAVARYGGRGPRCRPRHRQRVRQEHPEPPDRHQPQREPSVICPHGAGPAHVRSSPSGKNTGSRTDRRPPMSARIPRRGPYRRAAARQAGARLCRLAAVCSSATGGPVLHAGPASAVPGHLRLGVHRHRQGRGSIGTSLYYVPGIITLAIISAAFGNPGPGLTVLDPYSYTLEVM
jgi:hypothetical protein